MDESYYSHSKDSMGKSAYNVNVKHCLSNTMHGNFFHWYIQPNLSHINKSNIEIHEKHLIDSNK